MSSPFDNLTDEQRAAVVAEGAKVRVGAGPGSGKTKVLAARAAYLIDCGVPADEILCLTFTRSAAANIREQVRVACGKEIEVSTFHGFAARRVLKPGQRVATELEAEAAIQSLYNGPTRRPKSPKITQLKSDIVWYEAFDRDQGHTSMDTIKIVLHRLNEGGLVPTWQLVREAVLWQDEITPVSHVLIDEAQDCTEGENALARAAGGVEFWVGDDRQAIFGWRGASGSSILGPTHALTRTFRFGAAIAEVANEVAAAFGGAPIIGSDVESTVCRPSLSMIDEALCGGQSVAVLCRTHFDCDMAIQDLGGLDAVHIQRDPNDALANEADRIGDAIAAHKIVVATVHAAKGREFDVCHVHDSVFAACDGRAKREVTAEDHRVAYVAVTRARRVLMTNNAPSPIPTSDIAVDGDGVPL